MSSRDQPLIGDLISVREIHVMFPGVLNPVVASSPFASYSSPVASAVASEGEREYPEEVRSIHNNFAGQLPIEFLVKPTSSSSASMPGGPGAELSPCIGIWSGHTPIAWTWLRVLNDLYKSQHQLNTLFVPVLPLSICVDPTSSTGNKPVDSADCRRHFQVASLSSAIADAFKISPTIYIPILIDLHSRSGNRAHAIAFLQIKSSTTGTTDVAPTLYLYIPQLVGGNLDTTVAQIARQVQTIGGIPSNIRLKTSVLSVGYTGVRLPTAAGDSSYHSYQYYQTATSNPWPSSSSSPLAPPLLCVGHSQTLCLLLMHVMLMHNTTPENAAAILSHSTPSNEQARMIVSSYAQTIIDNIGDNTSGLRARLPASVVNPYVDHRGDPITLEMVHAIRALRSIASPHESKCGRDSNVAACIVSASDYPGGGGGNIDEGYANVGSADEEDGSVKVAMLIMAPDDVSVIHKLVLRSLKPAEANVTTLAQLLSSAGHFTERHTIDILCSRTTGAGAPTVLRVPPGLVSRLPVSYFFRSVPSVGNCLRCVVRLARPSTLTSTLSSTMAATMGKWEEYAQTPWINRSLATPDNIWVQHANSDLHRQLMNMKIVQSAHDVIIQLAKLSATTGRDGGESSSPNHPNHWQMRSTNKDDALTVLYAFLLSYPLGTDIGVFVTLGRGGASVFGGQQSRLVANELSWVLSGPDSKGGRLPIRAPILAKMTTVHTPVLMTELPTAPSSSKMTIGDWVWLNRLSRNRVTVLSDRLDESNHCRRPEFAGYLHIHVGEQPYNGPVLMSRHGGSSRTGPDVWIELGEYQQQQTPWSSQYHPASIHPTAMHPHQQQYHEKITGPSMSMRPPSERFY